MKTRSLFVVPLVVLCVVGLIGAGGEEQEENVEEVKTAPAHVAKGQLILVKDFSMENAELEGNPRRNKKRVATKKERFPSVLARDIYNQLLMQGYKAATYSSNESARGAFVIDGEFIRIHSNQRWMTVRMWVYHTDAPSKRLTQTEITGKSTGGKGTGGKNTAAPGVKPKAAAKKFAKGADNLAHSVVAHFLVHLPLERDSKE